jgi:hypothetical protein
MASSGINDNESIDYLKIPSIPVALIEPKLNKLLDNHAVALEIMAAYPEVLNRFKQKVRSDGKPDSTTQDELTKLSEEKYISTT